MEIWPGGTHLMPSGIDVENISKVMHSEQVLMPAGSLLIRDARMWHRGTPNVSDEPRPEHRIDVCAFVVQDDVPPDRDSTGYL